MNSISSTRMVGYELGGGAYHGAVGVFQDPLVHGNTGSNQGDSREAQKLVRWECNQQPTAIQ